MPKHTDNSRAQQCTTTSGRWLVTVQSWSRSSGGGRRRKGLWVSGPATLPSVAEAGAGGEGRKDRQRLVRGRGGLGPGVLDLRPGGDAEEARFAAGGGRGPAEFSKKFSHDGPPPLGQAQGKLQSFEGRSGAEATAQPTRRPSTEADPSSTARSGRSSMRGEATGSGASFRVNRRGHRSEGRTRPRECRRARVPTRLRRTRSRSPGCTRPSPRTGGRHRSGRSSTRRRKTARASGSGSETVDRAWVLEPSLPSNLKVRPDNPLKIMLWHNRPRAVLGLGNKASVIRDSQPRGAEPHHDGMRLLRLLAGPASRIGPARPGQSGPGRPRGAPGSRTDASNWLGGRTTPRTSIAAEEPPEPAGVASHRRRRSRSPGSAEKEERQHRADPLHAATGRPLALTFARASPAANESTTAPARPASSRRTFFEPPHNIELSCAAESPARSEP